MGPDYINVKTLVGHQQIPRLVRQVERLVRKLPCNTFYGKQMPRPLKSSQLEVTEQKL